MQTITTIGLDIAKSVFQVHGVDAGGAVVIRKRVGRAKVLELLAALPPCLAALRRVRALIIGAAGFGHSVTREADATELRESVPSGSRSFSPIIRSWRQAANALAISRPPTISSHVEAQSITK